MPKTSKKTYKKKTSQSWLTKYVPRSRAINSGAPGLSRSLKTVLKTSFYANLTHAATGVFTGYLSPGSCFDPCGDIATLQPSMYDQLAALYARYLVTDAEVYLEFTPSAAFTGTGAAADNTVVAVYPSTLSTALATYQGAASQSYSQVGTFGPTKALKMKFKLNTQKIVGSRLPVVAEDCGALVGGNPAAGQSIHLPMFIQHSNANAGQATMIRVTVVQHVIFDQKIQNQDA